MASSLGEYMLYSGLPALILLVVLLVAMRWTEKGDQ